MGRTAEGSGNTFLCTKEEFGDFELTFEVKLDQEGLNSGVQIRSQLRGDKYGGRATGPQVEIESSPGQSGFIYGEALGHWLSPEPAGEDKAAGQNDLVKDGQWNAVSRPGGRPAHPDLDQRSAGRRPEGRGDLQDLRPRDHRPAGPRPRQEEGRPLPGPLAGHQDPPDRGR